MTALIFRLIVMGVIFWIGWKVYKVLSKPADDNKPTPTNSADEEAILPCEICGIHISEKRALTHNGKYYCSKEHLDQHLNQ